MSKNQSDFRYNTGEAAVPWDAVGESFNEQDALKMLRFLFQGEGEEYSRAMENVKKSLSSLVQVSSPPGKLSLGSNVVKLENTVDSCLGVKDSLFVTNATAGFEIAFRYAGIKAGDEVLVPAITFIATMAYPLSVGAKVVFVDVDPLTLNMDPKDLERKITKKSKMIVPVHIGGYPVDMDAVMEVAEKHNLLVLEDAAHGFGGTYKGRPLGTIGHFGAFSFHEVKNITSFGEGGILVSRLPFAKEMKKARFLGLDIANPIDYWLYDVTALQGKSELFVAQNSSTTEIQAIALLAQLERYNKILAERKKNVEYLNSRLSECDALTLQPVGTEGSEPTYHLYLLQIDQDKAGGDIQQFRKKLEEKSVTSIPHFAPLYRFSIIRQLGYNQEEIARGCPAAEEAFLHRFTHLPVYGLSVKQLDYMVDAILSSVEEMRQGA